MADAPAPAPPARTPALAEPPLVLPGVTLRPLPPAARFALRVAVPLAARLEPDFGAGIPSRPLTSARAGARAALRLGPDEWLLLAEAGAEAMLPAALLAALAGAGEAVSIVDISHRQAAVEITGGRAAELINEGCPLDLSDPAFPPGACTRTLFGKVEILLWRPDAAPRYRIEAMRSYLPHLWAQLAEAARDLD